MILNINVLNLANFLNFRYFLIALLLIACGGDASKSNQNKQGEPEPVEEVGDESSISKTILFFGDSLTAGYGLEDSNDAYPALIQDRIDSLNLNYTVINSGLSGETTAGGRSRVQWVLNQQVDVFVLELGGNDGLRGVSLDETRENLQAIIDEVRTKAPNAEIILAGMQLPPNLGQDYTSTFRLIFNELAEENNIALIPFLLKDVGGIPELNLPDGIHPNEEGQKIVAQNVWEVLEGIIK